jgi:hypothetical protein
MREAFEPTKDPHNFNHEEWVQTLSNGASPLPPPPQTYPATAVIEQSNFTLTDRHSGHKRALVHLLSYPITSKTFSPLWSAK